MMATLELLGADRDSTPSRPRLVVSRRGSRARSGQPNDPPISNARLAVAMLIVAESMFFAGLIGAYLVFRFGTRVWPPPEMPRLPIGVTWLNTLVLMASGLTMWNAMHAARAQRGPALRRLILMTVTMGILFVAVQGYEWAQLVRFGLTLSSGTFGTTFYTLIGCHAAHVVIGVLWITAVGGGLARGWFQRRVAVVVETCGIYWLYVCGLWLVLFALVYN